MAFEKSGFFKILGGYMKGGYMKQIFLVGLLAVGFLSNPVKAVEIIITGEVPIVTNPSPYVMQFLEEIESETQGAVKGKYFPASQLYNDRDALAALGTGAVHMVLPVASRLELFDKRTGLLSLPFGLNQTQMTNKCFSSGLATLMSGYLEPAGMKILGFFRTAELLFVMRDKDIATVDDLRGKKIRVIGGKIMLDAMRSVKASPISMAASEMSVALSQGAIDGAMTSPAGWVDLLGTSAKYGVLFPGMSLAISPVVVDKVWFDGLDTSHREKIVSVLDSIIERQWRETVEKDKALVEQMVKKGSQYRVAEPAEVEKLRAAFKVVSTEFTKDNADVMAEVERLKRACSVN